MPLPTHLPHVIYATALTSLALHLLSARKAGVAARQQADARISLLDGLATRLRTGERVSADEVGRVRRLLKGDGSEALSLREEVAEKNVDWKAVVLGRKDDQIENETRSEEEISKEWEADQVLHKADEGR